MEKITFTCETITPMFLAGADGQTPELRAPSIKGALRFWWRAMNGGEFENLEDLRKMEGEIWGGVNPAKKSSIIIRVTPKEIPFDYQIDGDKLKKGKASDYFFYTLADQKQKTIEGDKKHRKGIKKHFQFEIQIKSRIEKNLEEAIKAFRFLIYLGGIGTRVRRCGGAFRVCEINDPKDYLNKWGVTFNGKFNQRIIENLPTNNTTLLSDYSNLSNADFYHSPNYYKNWTEAISNIASKMKNLREGIDPTTGIPFTQKTLNKKAAFGLPISVRNEENQVNFTNTEKNNRRASQFFISIYATEKNKLWWIVTKFNDEFMPPNQTIKFKSNEWNEPDYSLTNEFIEGLNHNKL